MKELIARVRNLFRPSNHFMIGYNNGYHEGVRRGHDFGMRVAHNRTLAQELPRILSRYSQLQVRIITKPKSEIQKALEKFEQDEIERLQMELQDR